MHIYVFYISPFNIANSFVSYIHICMNFDQAVHIILEDVIDTSKPKLILVRGIPGSGKSTVAKRIKESNPDISHYEADTYFVDDKGCYNFNPSLIKLAHNWCQNETKKDIESGKSVIVSNTFSQIWEMQNYFDLGLKYNCDIQVYEMSHEPVLQGKQKNIHEVPDNTILKMIKRWEPLSDDIVKKYKITLVS